MKDSKPKYKPIIWTPERRAFQRRNYLSEVYGHTIKSIVFVSRRRFAKLRVEVEAGNHAKIVQWDDGIGKGETIIKDGIAFELKGR